jgi:hypothetical protein
MNDEVTSVDQVKAFLAEIESYSPTRADPTPIPVTYRPVTGDEVIEESLPIEDGPSELGDAPGSSSASAQHETIPPAGATAEQVDDSEVEAPTAKDFQRLSVGPVAAVDCGIVRLGETINGLVIALRASIVIDNQEGTHLQLYRTGPIYLHNARKAEILYRMGAHLGRPEFFVEVDKTDPDNPKPTAVKSGVADDSHQFGDRFRNWLERVVQSVVVTSIENGVILLDGALTLRTRDTPATFLEQLAGTAARNGNSLIAISKRSVLQVAGRPIQFWLYDVPHRPCYRLLSPLMRKEGLGRVLGNAYAARYSVLGPTFRMDVKAIPGQSDDEAIGMLFGSTLMRGGYPDILVRAHTYSYFTSPDVVQLQAQAGAKYRLAPQPEVDLTGIFGPFGGRFK